MSADDEYRDRRESRNGSHAREKVDSGHPGQDVVSDDGIKRVLRFEQKPGAFRISNLREIEKRAERMLKKLPNLGVIFDNQNTSVCKFHGNRSLPQSAPSLFQT